MKKTITFLSRRAAVMLLATLLLTLTAQTAWADTVTYLDAIGTQKTAENPTAVSDMNELGSDGQETWYVVNSNVTINHLVRIRGTVHLILKDNKELTINASDEYGIYMEDGSSLTIYSQSKGGEMGKLTVTSGWYFSVENLTINGGIISITGGNNGVYIDVGGSMTVNNGVVTITSTKGGFAVNDSDLLHINGGTVTLNGVTYANPTTPTPKTLTYTGSAQELITAGSTNYGTIIYSLDGTNYSEAIPTATAAGTYTVYYKVAGGVTWNVEAQTVQVSINKATPTVTAPIPNTLTYTGSAQELVTAGSTNYGTIIYSLDGTNYSEAIPTATTVGTYTVYYKVDLDENWNVEAQTVQVSINKATPTVTAPIPNTLTYTGSAQALVTAGSTDFGTITYSLDGTNYSTDIPLGTTVGTYTVYYKVDEDENWNAVEAQTVQVSILLTYLDASGNEQSRMATPITSSDETFTYLGANNTESWYFAAGNVSLKDLVINGRVHLILADGANLTINGQVSVSGQYYSLTIYSQSLGENMGRMTVTSKSFVYKASLTINGGNISYSSSSGPALNIEISSVTINGGQVTITNESNTDGIKFSESGTLTLGYNSANDFIRINGITDGNLGTVNIKSGKHFVADDGDEIVTGNGVNYEAVVNKKLVPCHAVTFDANGGSFGSETTILRPAKFNTSGNAYVSKPDDPTREGYTFEGWKNGEDVYDFTTPVTTDLTLTAQWAAGDIYVGYLDPTAPIGMQRKTVLNPVRVDGNTTEMGTADETTWYLVSGTITNDTRIEVRGTVNLILTDGCNFTVSKGIHVPEGSALNIYAQSVANRGSLTANNYALPYYAAIGGNGGEGRDGDATSGESAGDITIYGGNITITNGNIGGGDGGNGRAGGQSYSDEYGEYSDYFAGNGGNGGNGNVTIYSGYVWVISGNIGGGKAGTGEDSQEGDSGSDGYNGDGTVNLSWANTSDRIYADYYYGSVTLQKAFYNIKDANIIDAGVVNNNDLLNGKNLIYAGDSYTVTIGSMPDGVTATADLELETAVVGQVVTISFSGVPYGKVPVVSVTYGANNYEVFNIFDNGDGTFSFVMPNGNATVTASDLIEKIPYIDADGNTAYCTNYTVLDNTMTTLPAGWYVVNSDVTVNSRIDLTDDTNLILGDGYTLDVKGIYIPQGSTLTIYAQSDGMTAGKIVSNPTSGAAIGGKSGSDNGNIVIHGGNIEAEGDDYCAGIGSANSRTGGYITIYGGTVTAKGGSDGAAIGGGRYCDGGTITIYGGVITANGPDDSDTCENGAGIGGGDYADGGNITIYGGNITTYSRDGAGIGGGDGGDGGIITINGGTITSTKVNQGQGARIGGGLDAAPGTITINGGKITAVGGSGAGIGGGKNNLACGTVTINGGVIDASGLYGIGAGENGADVAITLGWTNATDRIYASSYNGTVTILTGITYYDGTGASYTAGNLTSSQISAIAGKTLTPAIVLADNADNTSAIATATTLCTGGKTLAVQLSGRTLYKDGYWNTLCLPFSLGNSSAEEGHYFDGTLLAGATVKELDGSTSNLNSEGLLTLNFSDATSIEAGKPYIVKWASGDNLVNPVFTGVTVDKINNDVDFSGGTFMGNYKPLEITVTGDNPNRNDYVVLAVGTNGNMLGYVNTNRTLGAFHAYFYIPANGGNPGASSFVLNADDESTQTGIGHTEITDITEKADAIYDLQGRRVENPKKGLYIVNGRKVVIK